MCDTNEEEKKVPRVPTDQDQEVVDAGQGELINVSGHVQELDRSFGFWSIASLAICSDNAWGAGGASIVVS